MQITSDRSSVSAGDDMYNHQKTQNFDQNITLEQLIQQLKKVQEIRSNWTVWAGHYQNNKPILDPKGQWLVDKNQSISSFFRDIECYVFFRTHQVNILYSLRYIYQD